MKLFAQFVIVILLSTVCFANSGSNQGHISITDDLTIAMDLSKESDKHILLVFSADWCKYCQFLKQDIDEIKNIDNFIVCIIDSDKEILLYKQMKIKSLPTSIILDKKDYSETHRKIGYSKKEYEYWLFSNLSQ